MQSDLISRKALQTSIRREDVLIVDGLPYIRADAVRSNISMAPSLDADSDTHGQWLRENIRPKSYLRICSACSKIAYFCGTECSYKYCPNCGAKMDGGTQND